MNSAETLRPLNILFITGPELAGAGLDPQDLCRAVADAPASRVLLLDAARPGSEQEAQVREFFGQEEEIPPVLLVAKDPERRGAKVARLLQEELGVNQECLLKVDLAAALEHPEQPVRIAKSMEMIRLAALQVSLAKPMISKKIPVSRQVLVWGDSWAALRSAWKLAESGFPVILASPGQEFDPLHWDYAGNEGDSELELVRQVREHPLIRILPAARFKEFSGFGGNFTVRLDNPDECLTERVGAVILAPELEVKKYPQRCGVPDHPKVITQTLLEALLADSETNAPETVAILLGLAGESYPTNLKRILGLSSRLLEAGSQVYLFLNNAKVAGPRLQRLLNANQDAGLLVFKLRVCPAVSVGERGLVLTFFEPTLRQDISLVVNLVVCDDQYQAARENAYLTELLRLPLGAGGFLQSGNVHHIPVSTPRRGIFVIGPGRGIMDREEADTDVYAAVQAVQGLLGQGQAQALLGRALVDRGRCVLCLTCYRVCPHSAITWDNHAVINELACQGCGICASQCPNDAIQIINFSDEQMDAHFKGFDPQISPRIVAFMCRNSAWEAYQSAVKLHAASLPPGFTPIKLPCAGKVDPAFLLQAFTSGADGVLVLSCHQDNCKSSCGNLYGQWGVEQTRDLLQEAGVDPGRLLFHSLAANAPGDFIEAVDELIANLRTLVASRDDAYPVWLTTGIPYKEHLTVSRTFCALEPQGLPEVCIEIHTADARNLGVRSGEQIRASTREGEVIATAVATDRFCPGTAFLARQYLKDALNILFRGDQAAARMLQTAGGIAVRLEKVVEQFAEVMGVRMPTCRYFHRGHTWVAPEAGGRVRLGLDEFSQKVLGPADDIRLPIMGEEIRRDKVKITLDRGKERAGVLTPVTGVVEMVNPKVLKNPRLVHDDPYGEGWLAVLIPTSLQIDLENLVSGEAGLAWLEEEIKKLLAILDPAMAVLVTDGKLVDDAFGRFPELGWDRLVKEFLGSL